MFDFLKSLLGGVSSGLLGQVFGLTRAEREQNQFNAFEAQKQRDWSAMQAENANAFAAAEAQKNRDFQADQAATQYQRGVADMRAAGLNPALAYSQGGASAMSGATAAASMPSGSAASGSGRGIAIGLTDLMAMQKMQQDVRESESRVKVNEEQAQLIGKNTEYRGLEIAFFERLNNKQLEQIDSLLQTQAVERRLAESGIKVNEAKAALDTKQALLAGIDANTRAQLNTLEAKQRIAQIGLTYANTAEARKRIDLYSAEITETLQRAVTEAAQAGLYDQQTRNLLVEEGILQYDAETKEYLASKKKLTYTLDCVGKVVGAVGSAVSTGASVASGIGALRAGAGLLNGAAKAGVQNVARNKPLPRDSHQFDPYIYGTLRDY